MWKRTARSVLKQFLYSFLSIFLQKWLQPCLISPEPAVQETKYLPSHMVVIYTDYESCELVNEHNRCSIANCITYLHAAQRSKKTIEIAREEGWTCSWGRGLGLWKSGFNSWLCYKLSFDPGQVTQSLVYWFPICKMRIKVPTVFQPLSVLSL